MGNVLPHLISQPKADAYQIEFNGDCNEDERKN